MYICVLMYVVFAPMVLSHNCRKVHFPLAASRAAYSTLCRERGTFDVPADSGLGTQQHSGGVRCAE